MPYQPDTCFCCKTKPTMLVQARRVRGTLQSVDLIAALHHYTTHSDAICWIHDTTAIVLARRKLSRSPKQVFVQ